MHPSDSSFANYTAFAFFELCDTSKFMGYSNRTKIESPLEIESVNHAENKEIELNNLSINENNINEFYLAFDGVLSIFDLSGKLITSIPFNFGPNSFEFDDRVVSGVYFYTIMDSSNKRVYKSGLFSYIR